ncbi:glycosyltransferase family 2 protein [Immundisolibacter sp.]|uniref:glycosyltransferase family 2 protein n=1 Tax=Immundisolibacter sp. TaxID=1934948 RepID=UPI00356879B8
MNASDKTKLVSLVIPVCDEETTIGPFLTGMAEVLRQVEAYGYRVELLFVDDGSKDGTLAVLTAAIAQDARIRVLELSRNFGKEAALTAGIDAAHGDALIPIDVDLQDPPEVILQLIDAWEQGYEVVVGHRTDRGNDSLFKRQSARWFYKVVNAVADTPVPENVGDFRLIDRCVADALKRLPERRRFMKGLFAWVGFRTAVVDYRRAPRAAGTSKFSGWKLWNLALEGITSFSTAPLRLWTYIGAVVAGLAFVYALYIVFRVLWLGVDLPGYASLLVVVLFLGGIQLIGIGVLGEYLGRVYLEVKQRPTYIVRREHGGE